MCFSPATALCVATFLSASQPSHGAYADGNTDAAEDRRYDDVDGDDGLRRKTQGVRTDAALVICMRWCNSNASPSFGPSRTCVA